MTLCCTCRRRVVQAARWLTCVFKSFVSKMLKIYIQDFCLTLYDTYYAGKMIGILWNHSGTRHRFIMCVQHKAELIIVLHAGIYHCALLSWMNWIGLLSAHWSSVRDFYRQIILFHRWNDYHFAWHSCDLWIAHRWRATSLSTVAWYAQV